MKKPKLKNKVLVLVAIVLTLSMTIDGTYAMLTNGNMIPFSEESKILLHNDFAANENKDIYVENTGLKDVYVRIRFSEFLQVGNNILLGGKFNDTDTWHIYKPDCDCIAHEHYTWDMNGNSKIYRPNHKESHSDIYTLGQRFGDGTYAKSTLPETEIISFAEYIENRDEYAAESIGRWVIDTDGWCYWSKALEPDTATNLLIDNVYLRHSFDDNAQYAIHVLLQAADEDGLGDDFPTLEEKAELEFPTTPEDFDDGGILFSLGSNVIDKPEIEEESEDLEESEFNDEIDTSENASGTPQYIIDYFNGICFKEKAE